MKFVVVALIVILDYEVTAKYYNNLEMRKPLLDQQTEWIITRHMVDLLDNSNSKVNFSKRMTTAFVEPVKGKSIIDQKLQIKINIPTVHNI